MKQHYDGDTPVVTLNCAHCGGEFESYGLTIKELQDFAYEFPSVLQCGECDPD